MSKCICSLTILLAIGTTSLLSKSAPAEQGKPGDKQADYYPLAVGTKWYLQVEVGGKTVDAVSQIAKIEKIGNESLARLEVSVGEK